MLPDEIVSAPMLQFKGLSESSAGINWNSIIFLALELSFLYVMTLNGLMRSFSDMASLTKCDGAVPGGRWVYIICGVTTIVSGLMAAPPVLISPESAGGIKAGARTGLSTCICGLCFGMTASFGPLFKAVPATGTAPLLIIIGVLLFQNVQRINWSDIRMAVPAFCCLFFIPLTYNLSHGIYIAFVLYAIIGIFTRDFWIQAYHFCKQYYCCKFEMVPIQARRSQEYWCFSFEKFQTESNAKAKLMKRKEEGALNWSDHPSSCCASLCLLAKGSLRNSSAKLSVPPLKVAGEGIIGLKMRELVEEKQKYNCVSGMKEAKMYCDTTSDIVPVASSVQQQQHSFFRSQIGESYLKEKIILTLNLIYPPPHPSSFLSNWNDAAVHYTGNHNMMYCTTNNTFIILQTKPWLMISKMIHLMRIIMHSGVVELTTVLVVTILAIRWILILTFETQYHLKMRTNATMMKKMDEETSSSTIVIPLILTPEPGQPHRSCAVGTDLTLIFLIIITPHFYLWNKEESCLDLRDFLVRMHWCIGTVLQPPKQIIIKYLYHRKIIHFFTNSNAASKYLSSS